ncbi:mannose-1-phosphate guanylyltransferase/mannose-6-phosphate isomerase [Alphaproteobacteria bacterium]|nr:mannose-1-phosphate guanylyltransferase/mannose-6-phosphate isomerase [Alphaproteobacteria bacterium]MDA9581434.1 mannose-1-phosphate guanylyltransferase/mannose-6-phosphate isomerase [bacterium]MDA8625699.1 mannose-1-phosphate guanylyltransferase/mannose-6-phosphate isomerase [Alphaproteobacteria bacterium]MDA8642642.1 mannose-1-phosphate guanylyltransferase/mannose-6-phosphate isomerase [Alphaproteobacteria bacterium]MDA8666462.1 mannose-1-phosphate guanylyltransferase/mannose-6-phosphate 
MSKIIPIILSGGAGSRLWPVSRRMHPKPFMEIAGKALLAHALERAALVSDDALIVTNQDHYFLTEKLLRETKKAPRVSYLLEPKGRNTGPAIALAVRHIQKAHGDDAVCLVLAADHLISDDAALEKAVTQAAQQAQAGNIVVFGIRPTAPETGYGYLEVEAVSDNPQPLQSFVEKPNRAKAEKYLAEGRFYWNSGMFCFTAGVMSENMAVHADDVWAASETAFAGAQEAAGVTRFAEDSFIAQPDISIDYAVMEKAEKIAMVPAGFGWSDVGSWDAVAGAHDSDARGNSVTGADKVQFVEARGTHIASSSHREKVIAAIGVESLVIIDMPDALLVADRAKSQDVKLVVEALKASADAGLTELPATVHRTWGTYATLFQEEGYQVKRITVAPGQKLSLQYHHKRAEHWVVTQGQAIVQVGDEEIETGPGEYRYIPLGEKHRLTNIGDGELVLIEIQIGSYLGEDDIVRIEDVYGRSDSEGGSSKT